MLAFFSIEDEQVDLKKTSSGILMSGFSFLTSFWGSIYDFLFPSADFFLVMTFTC